MLAKPQPETPRSRAVLPRPKPARNCTKWESDATSSARQAGFHSAEDRRPLHLRMMLTRFTTTAPPAVSDRGQEFLLHACWRVD